MTRASSALSLLTSRNLVVTYDIPIRRVALASAFCSSDISPLIANRRHKILVAGDFNILRGYGEHGSPYWGGRYETVFTRMEALGLSFVGPEAPNGRQADPWPDELPRASKNVPTYRSTRQTPATATRQLDFVFASESIADRVRARAMNGIDEWGPSDHCRVVIDIAEP